MMRTEPVRGYEGGYLIGFVMIGVVTLRDLISFHKQPTLLFLIGLIGLYALHYALEPWLANRYRIYSVFYFPFQTLIVIILSNLRPFNDISCLLYVPLSIQIFRRFPRRTALVWMVIYIALLATTLMLGLGLLEGLALVLLYLAVFTFLIRYDFLYSRTQADQAESQRLLTDLQSAHQKLQEYAAQAEELVAVRERNRLARELHDSVSQSIFSIKLTSQSARMLLEHEPARVPEQIDRLQTMTNDALARLRSLILQLRPPQKSQ